MIHISPWEATIGLMRGAGERLSTGAPLYLYGPYRRAAESNEAFDRSHKSRNPAWGGLRDVDDVVSVATRYGLAFETLVEMPANNLSLILRKT